MTTSIARPNKLVGRVVLGPRVVKTGYARIVAAADGSGRLELFDIAMRAWRDASGTCTFDELWRADSAFDLRYLSGIACGEDSGPKAPRR